MANYSIKDIAQLSGVSPATVSRVINDNGRFSEATRQKVLAVIQETGYQTNYSAKSLRMHKSFSIGVLVPDISNHFFASLVQQIEAILFDQGYSTIICNTARSSTKEQAYLQMLASKGIDGLVIISGPQAFDIEQAALPTTIPYVCIDREPKQRADTVFIAANHYQGAFDATEALLQRGCQRPIMALHAQLSSSGTERLHGFQDALKKNNRTFDAQTQLLQLTDTDRLPKLKAYLAKFPATDGIFAVNDALAVELLSALTQLGQKVPAEIQLIGFDDDPLDQHTTPTLSSVKQDLTQLAQVTVDNLLKAINHQATYGKSISIPVTLALRESTK
ncbi:LacI family DNA-binding transcriptional regulator [Lactiplantibacillus daowaiensis]|uniref:LacI family DNA-binding transcriptional regulator n=1 Tax=Lactiplantibacillus daowaiensis TaxID=2559918 RepID=A0ABW1S3Q2_9LACO